MLEILLNGNNEERLFALVLWSVVLVLAWYVDPLGICNRREK